MNKPVKTYTPLMSEVLTKVNNAKDKAKKIAVLKEHDSEPLRMLIKSSFDPKIQWVMPPGDVPYTKDEAPAGTEHTTLASQSNKLWHFIKGADAETPQWKKEQMFVQILETVDPDDAKLLIEAKDRKIKGCSKATVKQAFPDLLNDPANQ